jgi:hypothetical protein
MNTTTREFSENITNALTGEVTVKPHTLVVVGTGINYQDASGAWQQARDLITLTPDGGAAAPQGSYTVKLAPGLNQDAALTIKTAAGNLYQARVVGVYYFDQSTGQSNLLAAPSNAAVGELLPPNQVVYHSAFNSPLLQADLRYTYTKAAFESEVILTAQPKVSPSDCGLNPATTLLQVRHQWLAPAIPRIQTINAGPGPSDELLDFGDLWFPRGRAFGIDGGSARATNVVADVTVQSPASTNWVGVGKEWRQGAPASALIESVAWTDIAPRLSALPLIARVPGGASTNLTASAAATPQPGNAAADPARPIRLAALSYRPAGLVVDYQLVCGSVSNYTFQTYGPGPMYAVENNNLHSPIYASGTLTFEPGCVIRFCYDPDGYSPSYILAYGGIACNGTWASPSVFTSWYDNQYGDPDLLPSGDVPSQQPPGTALWLYYIPTNVTVSGVCVRYAQTAIEFEASSSTLTESVSDAFLYSCGTGILDSYNCPSVSIANSQCYQVTNLLSCACEGNPFSGSFSQGAPPPVNDGTNYTASLLGDNFTLSMPVSPPTVVDWYVVPPGSTYPGGMVYAGSGANCTLSPQLLASSGTYCVYAGVSNPFGSNYYYLYTNGNYSTALPYLYLAVASSEDYNSLMNFELESNGETTNMWENLPLQAVDPPGSIPGNYQWNKSSILYNKGSFTAISQLNYWNLTNICGCPGQKPMTAVTRRHVITAGHVFVPFGTPSTPLGMPPGGAPVWFCDLSNNIIQMTAAAGYARYDADGDYSVLILSQDLPSDITPMPVDTTQAEWWTIYLQTEQRGHVAAYTPGFPMESAQWLPFDHFNWGVAGDSGSPTMLLTSSGQLVLVGATLNGPSPTVEALNNIQADMDGLITNVWNNYQSNSQHQLSTANYQMQGWYNAP